MPEDELAKHDDSLRVGPMNTLIETRMREVDSHTSRLLLRHEMTSTTDLYLGPVSLLMHNSCELATVIKPWSRRRASKALVEFAVLQSLLG